MAGVIDKTIDKAIGKKNRRIAHRHFSQWVTKRFERLFTVRKWVLDWFALVAALLLLIGIQANWFGRVYLTTDWVSGGSYSEATFGRITTLNPLYASNSSENAIRQLLFSSLFKYDRSGNIRGDLATSIRTEDGRRFEVEIRQDAFWHDGERVNANDVVRTFQFIRDPNARAAMAETFHGVTITKLDEYKVAFDLQNVYFGFANYLTFSVLPEHLLRDVLPENLVENSFSRNPVGSGPFKFNLLQDGEGGENIVFMDVNREYYGGQPLLDRFIIYSFADRQNMIRAINSGMVDASAQLNMSEKDVVTNRNMTVYETAMNSGVFAFLNTRSTHVNDVNFRRALQIGINAPRLRMELGGGSLMAQDFPYLNRLTGLTITEMQEAVPVYNLERAREILTSNGYVYDGDNRLTKDGERVEVRLVTLDVGLLAGTAIRVAEDLSMLGIYVQTDIVPNDTAAGLGGQQSFLQNFVGPRAYDILIYDADLSADGDAFAIYHSSQMGSTRANFSNYSSRTADDLLLSVRLTGDADLQAAKRRAFTRLWLSDVPAIGLYRSNLIYWHMRTVRPFAEDVRIVTSSTRFTDVIYWSANRQNVYRTP
ncbi:ABC transporter substrate-binding protein [Candidatus Saccharibacteria bacterium]|nr:ABC transporter substrate-binding protein [Candidatus Saccharibacteria bacterium]